MSNPERSTSQEHEKSVAPQSSLLTEVRNSTDTKGKRPQPHTDELRHTDELYCTGELPHTDELYDTGELHAGTSKRNENTLRSHDRPKITQKLVSESDSYNKDSRS